MKLLIVDDEELTRTGLISAIDWKSLGIDQIIQADDGIHGLEQARLYKPEIILCDVRMPRMNGITMLERLEKLLPDSVPVFMSGYSDKEYLKAAIRLKAVSYIEKPLNPSEVSQADSGSPEESESANSLSGDAETGSGEDFVPRFSLSGVSSVFSGKKKLLCKRITAEA